MSAEKKEKIEKMKRCVLVGTYKKEPDQLKWIGKHHLYNYPLSEEEVKSGTDGWSKVKELWLYSGSKDRRHIYTAEFVGIKHRKEFFAENPDYPKSKKPHGDFYAVFRIKFKYQPTIEDSVVIVRANDFKRTPKVAKAVKAYQTGGELGSLLDILPAELAPLSHDQLRVYEAALQMNFICSLFAPAVVKSGAAASPDLRYKVISLFSGAMGLDNGIEKAGLSIKLCVEIQHAMAETIRANKPDVPLIEDDVRNYSGDDLKRMAGIERGEEVFLVCGGPPCQAFSTAGKRLGFDDDRGNVFLKYIDLIGEIRPKYYLLENVRGLLSAGYNPEAPIGSKPAKGTALLYALDRIHALGYSATFTLYDAANYGVPQRRERVIILGSRDGFKIPLIPPTHSAEGGNGLKNWATFREAITGLTKCTALPIPQKRLKYFRMLAPGQYWKCLPEELQRVAMGKSYDLPGGKTGFYRRLAWDVPSPTLVTCPTMPATDLMHPTEDRALSVEEYARIQMFPDNWIFKGSLADKYKQIGNAVPVGMGYAAAKHLLWFDSLSDEQKKSVRLVDHDAVYSRYKNTSFEYFDGLQGANRMTCKG